MRPYRYEYQFTYRLPYARRYPDMKHFQSILAHNLTDAMRTLPRRASFLKYVRVEVTA